MHDKKFHVMKHSVARAIGSLRAFSNKGDKSYLNHFHNEDNKNRSAITLKLTRDMNDTNTILLQWDLSRDVIYLATSLQSKLPEQH